MMPFSLLLITNGSEERRVDGGDTFLRNIGDHV